MNNNQVYMRFSKDIVVLRLTYASALLKEHVKTVDSGELKNMEYKIQTKVYESVRSLGRY